MKPPPRELNRKRFWHTVSGTVNSSGSLPFTRMPSTVSSSGAPFTE